ncbi:peptidoglycan DD-metalloendopeptidase family protein [Flavobacterium sp.]|uniref:M23 family metallopeptidase n=1 Tax=Flavobacterium sp. TaxID=239 RepID=UPI0025B7FF00|nr:peptidoglycan DD-metalloendopeptidase family protein [Flavobacterium sp.]MBA4152873.1 peptidase M23 [Flavobacterium sp.]
MKFKIVTISLITLLLFACEEKDKKVVPKEVIKEEPIIVEFGFTYNDYLVVQDTVQSGDTFSKLLEENNIGTFKVHDVTEMVKDSFNLRDIRIGKPFTLLKSKKAPHQLQVFIYQKDNIHYSVVDFRDTVVIAYNKQKPITIKRRTIATSISGSLSETLSKNGVDASMANNLAKIYEYSIDFFKIQKDDKFAVTFYEKYINDSIYAGVERMESSFFEHKGKKIYAFPYKLDSLSKKVDYYDEEGKGLKTMFLKAPLDYFRISSRFSPKRFHPVQMTWKAHKGTDYAAAQGTPIKTTASGVVEKTGYTAGNGNFVKVKHNGTYSTQYLHMSKILVRQGQRVEQGQVIGKVGSTGLATGPHVCYRFWKNGVQVDPLSQKLPNTEPMNEKHRKNYLTYIAPLKRELDSIATLQFKK